MLVGKKNKKNENFVSIYFVNGEYVLNERTYRDWFA
jgi:hypothetical protein